MANLATLATVKEHAEINVTTWDAPLTTLLARVSAAIRKHVRGRPFESTNYTEYYAGELSDTIQLRHIPVTAITSVHEDSARTTYNASTLIAAADYTYDQESGILSFDYRLPRGNRNVRVVYTAGDASVPEDVALSCVIWTLHIWARAKSHGMSSESGGNVSGSYDLGPIPEEVANLLAEYVVVGSSA